MKLILPAILNPLSRRKDKSVLLKFDTRELSAQETFELMNLEGTEGWITFQPNQEEVEMPEEIAKVDDLKSPSTRLRNALYRVYKHETDNGKYVGLFETYYKDKLEKFITHTLNQLPE